MHRRASSGYNVPETEPWPTILTVIQGVDIEYFAQIKSWRELHVMCLTGPVINLVFLRNLLLLLFRTSFCQSQQRTRNRAHSLQHMLIRDNYCTEGRVPPAAANYGVQAGVVEKKLHARML